MELIQVKQHILDSGHRYTGWGYFQGASFIPHACGKKYYSDFYAYGNFHDGIITGPALIATTIICIQCTAKTTEETVGVYA